MTKEEEERERRTQRPSRKSQESSAKSASSHPKQSQEEDFSAKTTCDIASTPGAVACGQDEQQEDASSLLEMTSISSLDEDLQHKAAAMRMQEEQDDIISDNHQVMRKEETSQDHQQQQDVEEGIVTAAVAATTVVEATPVEEIVATQVVPETPSMSLFPTEDVTIQQVQMDISEPFEMERAPQRNPDETSPDVPAYQYVVVSLLLVGSFAGMVLLYFGLVVPKKRASSDDECENAYNEQLHRIQVTRGMALIQYTTLSVMLVFVAQRYFQYFSRLYCVVEESDSQDEEDSSKKPSNMPPAHIFYRMAMFFWNLMVLFVTLAIRIYIALYPLDNTEGVEEFCSNIDNNPPPSLPQISFQVPTTFMAGLAVFTTIARYHVVFNAQASNRRQRKLSPFWRSFWDHIGPVLEVVLFIFSSVLTFGILSGQILEPWEDWDPTLSSP